jgi:hypothetical protein
LKVNHVGLLSGQLKVQQKYYFLLIIDYLQVKKPSFEKLY